MDYNRMGIDMKRTGERIKYLCTQRVIAVKDIQEQLQIGAFQSVYNWFQGKALPSLDNLVIIADVLQVKMEEILVIERERGTEMAKSYIDTKIDEWKAIILDSDPLKEEKEEKLQAAIDLGYNDNVLEKIVRAKSEMQIYRAMMNARTKTA